MNKAIKLTLLAGLLLPIPTHAQLEVRELGLNDGGASKNVTVVPQSLETELGKYSFSYDIDEIIFNHQYDAAKHVIDRLQMPDQTKIYVFWYNSLIEKNLMPNSIPEGSVTLSNILLKSDFNTSMVKNRQDFDAYMRHNFTRKLNQIVPVEINRKVGNKLLFSITNNTDFTLREIYGNLRVVDTVTKQVYIDQDVSKYVGLSTRNDSYFTLDIPLRVEGWETRQENLAYKFTVKRVHLSNGMIFDADQYYFKIMGLKPVINDFPFTQIKEK